MSARIQSRRAASKEALKQMHILLEGDEEQETVEIPDDDDDDDVIAIDAPPKKKYKVTQKKSSDDREVLVLRTITNHNSICSLELECYPDKLSEVQLARKKAYEEDELALQTKLDAILKSSKATVVHKGDLSAAYESATEKITVKKGILASNPPIQSQPIILNPGASAATPSTSSGTQSFQLMMDPRFGLVAVPSPSTTQSPSGQTTKVYSGKVQMSGSGIQTKKASPQNTITSDTRQMRTRRTAITAQTVQVKKSLISPKSTVNKTTPMKTHIQYVNNNKTTPTATVKQVTSSQTANESIAAGGLSIGSPKISLVPRKMSDLTQEAVNAPDSREIAFNKLQGKTYPSLVVVARPSLYVNEAKACKDRPKLDNKVKQVLMYQATKFTEWLIQQGLVRSEQRCAVHPNNLLKLGMYSEVHKFPYSGGYVWITDCCPSNFVSVFSGSIFEGCAHPPMVILKLIYHWACQTNIQNVTQWVQVDNLFVKYMYTWLRCVCTVAVQTHVKRMGGPGVNVELGIISLGTTSQDGAKRQVKVEVLGVLESSSKRILLRAVDPVDKAYKRRFSKILEPIVNWIHPSSTILTDLTVDKATLRSMGFNNVIQNTGGDFFQSNKYIMDYLRRVVPRMFQNTLSLLSRQIIQQFLDELVWREMFGTTPLEAFDSITAHLAEQTRENYKLGLMVRLNKVAVNPFRNWKINPNPQQIITIQQKSIPTASTIVATPFSADFVNQQPQLQQSQSQPPPLQPLSRRRQRKQDSDTLRPPKSTSPDIPEQLVPLENYYYGTIERVRENSSTGNLNLTIKCPICKKMFFNNLQLMNHLFKHAHNANEDAHLCRYCLTIANNSKDMLTHIANNHPSSTRHGRGFVCLICESVYKNAFILGKHMSRDHCPSELPYQCGTCGFRCSNHKQAVDHFYESHNNGPTIQCPFCLKSTTIYSVYRNLVHNVNYFIQHLQKHQRKQCAKKCPKCSLWFIQKDLIKDHIIKMHVSQRGKPGLLSSSQKHNSIMVPKSKMDISPSDANVINFERLHFKVSKHLICKECNIPLDSFKHFSSFASCQNANCLFSTCCSNAMTEHAQKCNKQPFKVGEDPLPYKMYCVCGFHNTDGNKMARHLVMCERKSAYPSKEDAKSACVKNRLLDTLGLVRKPDEQPPVVENDEPITIDSPPHNEMEDSVMEELTKLDDINDINNQIEEEEEEVKEIKDSENENTNEPIYDVEMLNNDVTRNEMEVDQTETTNSNDNFIESTEISEKQKDNLEMETNVVLAGS